MENDVEAERQEIAEELAKQWREAQEYHSGHYHCELCGACSDSPDPCASHTRE